jgi:hypothetical protein
LPISTSARWRARLRTRRCASFGPAPAELAGQNIVDPHAPAYATFAEKADRRALE